MNGGALCCCAHGAAASIVSPYAFTALRFDNDPPRRVEFIAERNTAQTL